MFSKQLIAVLFCGLAGHVAAAAPAVDLVAAAKAQVGVTLSYDPSYARLAYPGGDVPLERGVCTDVIVRAYRKIGIDLQKLVHEDMRAAWNAYSHAGRGKLGKPDPNIDHRRVPNLSTFFRRHGMSLKTGRDPADYRPGDVVAWRLDNGLLHIGMVADAKSPDGVPLIVHNIGSGAKLQDMLFDYTIIGHFRYPKVPDA
jgi:uncharacterized protein YijF (DUF1287 family)